MINYHNTNHRSFQVLHNKRWYKVYNFNEFNAFHLNTDYENEMIKMIFYKKNGYCKPLWNFRIGTYLYNNYHKSF